jgi:hypothetical protein
MTGMFQWGAYRQPVIKPKLAHLGSVHCDTNASPPTGYGCVGDVLARGSCGTARNSMGIIPWPLEGSSRNRKPRLVLTAIALRGSPFTTVSYSIGVAPTS